MGAGGGLVSWSVCVPALACEPREGRRKGSFSGALVLARGLVKYALRKWCFGSIAMT